MHSGRIIHAKIVLPDGIWEDGTVVIRNGRIAAAGAPDTVNGCDGWIVDCAGDWLIPGLIDIHVHGAGGSDTMDGTADSLRGMARALLAQGTTAFLATTMSSPPDALAAALAAVAKARAQLPAGAAEILGVHMEGPFLAPAYKGAQAANAIYPVAAGDAAAVFSRLAAAHPGLIRILTLAVERPEAAELVRVCHEQGVIPSAGHSAAGYEEMRRAVGWGVLQVTHAFNAMPPLHHRHPGLLTEALKNSAVRLELIADGIHIHPAVIEWVLQIKPAAGVILVSDGTRAVGMPDGDYELGGQMTRVGGGVAMLPDGTIAGGACPLLQGVKTVAKLYDLPRAVRHASLIPARLLGVDQRIGSIAPGKEATLVRLDAGLEIKQVWQRGELFTAGR